MTIRSLFLILLIGILAPELHARIKRSHRPTYYTKVSSCTKGPITIFIHGTVFPLVSRFLQHDATKRGLYRFNGSSKQPLGKERIAYLLFAASPEEFPAESFHHFYWSGSLTFQARKEAAHTLYDLLKDHTGPITLVAHSHGCNVALSLAQRAQEKGTSLSIDRLILLAPPVQRATAPLIHSPCFKRIYSLYSTADFPQVADPQGLYHESKGTDGTKSPLFSERTFPASPRLMQARILIGRRSPLHIDFIRARILKHLPCLLKLLDTAFLSQNNHVLIDIPACGNGPHLLDFRSASLPYQTRRQGQCTCSPGRHG